MEGESLARRVFAKEDFARRAFQGELLQTAGELRKEAFAGRVLARRVFDRDGLCRDGF